MRWNNDVERRGRLSVDENSQKLSSVERFGKRVRSILTGLCIDFGEEESKAASHCQLTGRRARLTQGDLNFKVYNAVIQCTSSVHCSQ